MQSGYTAISGANAASPTCGTSQVDDQVNDLVERTNYVIARMELLHERLQKVSRGAPPQAVGAKIEDVALCPLASQLRDSNRKLGHIASVLDITLELLEV